MLWVKQRPKRSTCFSSNVWKKWEVGRQILREVFTIQFRAWSITRSEWTRRPREKRCGKEPSPQKHMGLRVNSNSITDPLSPVCFISASYFCGVLNAHVTQLNYLTWSKAQHILDTWRLSASDDLSLCFNDETVCQDAAGTNIISYRELLLTAVVKVNSIFI